MYDLMKLRDELRTAGFAVGFLCSENTTVFEIGATGSKRPLAGGELTVVAAHDPAPASRPPQPDVSDASQDAQIATAVTNLRTYLNTASPTAADSTTALKLLIRVVIWILKRFVVTGLYP